MAIRSGQNAFDGAAFAVGLTSATLLEDPPPADVSRPVISADDHALEDPGCSRVGRSSTHASSVGTRSRPAPSYGNRGVRMISSGVVQLYLRRYTPEWPCRFTRQVEALGRGTPLPPEVTAACGRRFEDGTCRTWWDVAVRRWPEVLVRPAHR